MSRSINAILKILIMLDITKFEQLSFEPVMLKLSCVDLNLSWVHNKDTAIHMVIIAITFKMS